MAYQKNLHLRKLTAAVLTAVRQDNGGATAQETVRYLISATVALSDDPRALSGTWGYTASLVAFEHPGSPVWSIAWAPQMLAPGLTDSASVAVVGLPPATTGAVDAGGTSLAAYSDAGLTTIASDLQNQAQANSPPGTPGLAVELQTGSGDLVPGTQAVIAAPRAGPGLATTIDKRAEAAARTAVSAYPSSSIAAIQPSTGKILAVANADDDDDALTARVAPGSTMKVITAAALLNTGVLTASSGIACPQSYTIQGVTYHNDNDQALPAGTPFITDFAQSCNNAFSTQWTHLSGLLASTAQMYFGLNQAWNIGIAGQSASYFNAPADASGSELAQEAFGEGQLLASPLAMASVAATVDTGVFRQPYLLPGTPQVTATALPAGTDAQLQEMMRAVVTSGTAAPVGFGPDVYAKTGTADVAGQDQPNSWLIAFDPAENVAVACLVLDAGYGAQYAGSEVKTFLDNY
jgi:cell division protein FtsI/penicillin-binding protein 2